MKYPNIRLIIIFLSILAELYALDFFKNGTTQFSIDNTFRSYLGQYGTNQFWLAIHSSGIFRKLFFLTLLSLAAFLVTNFQKSYFITLFCDYRVNAKALIINFCSFILLLGIMILINDPIKIIDNPCSLVSIIYTVSPAIWLIFFLSIIECIFSLKRVSGWIFENGLKAIFIFGVVGLATIPALFDRVLIFWSDLLLQPTLKISLALTRGVGLDTRILQNAGYAPNFGTSKFAVEILPSCSGYEGMALIITLLLFYCYLQREQVRVPLVILMIPLAGLAMFFLNSVRIAILIAIGHVYSAQLALEGFHVVGGWLNLLIVFVVWIFAFNYFSCFLRYHHLPKTSSREDFLFLLPLFSIIMIGFFTKVFSIGFDWLYPVPILFSALIILYYQNFFRLIPEKISGISYIIGVLIFIIWVLIVPVDVTKSHYFFQEIEQSPLGLGLLWLSCRVIGAVLIVPIAEELAFRGYALPRFQTWLNESFTQKGLFNFSPHHIKLITFYISLFATSILFGFLHSDFVAGTLAGLGFGIAYLYKRKLFDAIVAHSVTNALLAIYVIVFGYWSYW